MKPLSILVLLSLATTNAYGLDCLPFYPGSKNAKIVWQKKCDVLIEDSSPVKIKQATACLSELRNAYPKNVKTIALSVDLIKETGLVKKAIIINYTNSAIINDEMVMFEQVTASPEIFRRYKTTVNYDKASDVLSIKSAEGTFSLSTKFHFKMHCH